MTMAKPSVTLDPPPSTNGWRCILCDQIVVAPGRHYCIVEARIREIIREEIAGSRPTVNGDAHG